MTPQPERQHDTAHDVDGGIVTIEQAGSRDDTNVVLGGVDGFFFH